MLQFIIHKDELLIVMLACDIRYFIKDKFIILLLEWLYNMYYTRFKIFRLDNAILICTGRMQTKSVTVHQYLFSPYL